jgi:hypothetical protein
MVQPVRSTDPADLEALWPGSESNCAIDRKLSGEQGESEGWDSACVAICPKNGILRQCHSMRV